MRVVTGLALLAAMAAGAADAAATRYECAFDVGNRRDGNWVPSVLVVTHTDGAPTALVYDPIIRDTLGRPVEARLADTSPVRTAFSWTLDLRDGRNRPVTMNYTFIHYTNGTPAKVTVVPAGFDNRFSGNGTCTLTRG